MPFHCEKRVKENIDGLQFHEYWQSKQSPLTPNFEQKKPPTTYGDGNSTVPCLCLGVINSKLDQTQLMSRDTHSMSNDGFWYTIILLRGGVEYEA